MAVKSHELREKPRPHNHFVQLYTDELALARNVGKYLHEGLVCGEAGIAIASPEHCTAFRANLRSRGVDVDVLEQSRKLLFLDAAQTLSRFLVAGRPDFDRFESTICEAVGSLARGERQVRGYGEMVGLLWTSGEYSAAIRLEEYWNRILNSLGASLYCAYPIDVFSDEFEASGVHAILCDHTHLLPGDDTELLEATLRRATEEVAGSGVCIFDELKGRAGWGTVPAAEQMILMVRERLPNSAPEILRLAREEYRTRCPAEAN